MFIRVFVFTMAVVAFASILTLLLVISILALLWHCSLWSDLGYGRVLGVLGLGACIFVSSSGLGPVLNCPFLGFFVVLVTLLWFIAH